MAALSTGACVQCTAGFHDGDSSAATPCTQCGTGKEAAAGVLVCTDCPAGRFDDDASTNSNSAATQCEDCADGRYAASGQTACTECSAGFADADVGGPDPSTPCDQCAEGKYAAAGATACTSCPGGQYDDDASAGCSSVSMSGTDSQKRSTCEGSGGCTFLQGHRAGKYMEASGVLIF